MENVEILTTQSQVQVTTIIENSWEFFYVLNFFLNHFLMIGEHELANELPT